MYFKCISNVFNAGVGACGSSSDLMHMWQRLTAARKRFKAEIEIFIIVLVRKRKGCTLGFLKKTFFLISLEFLHVYTYIWCG